MRDRLRKFTAFTERLLPHETAYLLRHHQLEDDERIAILERVERNSREVTDFIPYDASIDKRKYHHLRNWMEKKLAAIDVDERHAWLLRLERLIVTDSIEHEDERQLLRAIRHYEHPGFYFMKFYEVLGQYRHFLQIRMRYRDYALVNDFLATHAEAYDRSKQGFDRLHAVTQDVVEQYARRGGESWQWAESLERVFLDKQMDGLNRYLALVRLTFVSFNHREYDRILAHFDRIDRAFRDGRNYSPRLLTNYYGNRMLLHAYRREYERALYYGRLSVRSRNYDHLFYVNNLASLLLRLDRQTEALELLQGAKQAAKTTVNSYNRIGYTAFYLEALLKTGRPEQAESYGDSYLRAYRKEILRYRWHLFFTVYLLALLRRGQAARALRVIRKFKLPDRDAAAAHKPGYLPTIPTLSELARWREGLLTDKEFHASFRERLHSLPEATEERERFAAFCRELEPLLQ
ncbi:hypothetical protein [Lewinella sp. JB7]|uniref:hypothetical protein n=1 Tax=Lewinella sp. JB7 TaxID=2962887 RepID=UPI0020C9CD54|nr:hypothetical protein [Lewinella sp. JB7]